MDTHLSIVLCTDGSLHALEAASWVNQQLADCHASVRVVTVVGLSSADNDLLAHGLTPIDTENSSTAIAGAWTKARARAESALEQTIHVLQHVSIIGCDVLEDIHPATAIINYGLTHSADVIVVGRPGHSLVGRLLGSLSFALMQNSPIPVTIIGAYSLMPNLPRKN